MLINISGHWCVNFTLIWLLAFHLGLGLSGIWLAKLALEIYIMVAYGILIWGCPRKSRENDMGCNKIVNKIE